MSITDYASGICHEHGARVRAAPDSMLVYYLDRSRDIFESLEKSKGAPELSGATMSAAQALPKFRCRKVRHVNTRGIPSVSSTTYHPILTIHHLRIGCVTLSTPWCLKKRRVSAVLRRPGLALSDHFPLKILESANLWRLSPLERTPTRTNGTTLHLQIKRLKRWSVQTCCCVCWRQETAVGRRPAERRS